MNSFFDHWYQQAPAIKTSLHPSAALPPSIPSSPSCRVEQRREAGMSKAHVRRRKGFCGGRRDEAVRGNAVSADTQVSRASLCLLLPCACPLLPCLITLHVRYYRYCQGAWRGCTVGMHGAKFWHGALETALCCFDVPLKACVPRQANRDRDRGRVCSLWLEIVEKWVCACMGWYFKVRAHPSMLVHTVVTLRYSSLALTWP